jgi:hypothetical protein
MNLNVKSDNLSKDKHMTFHPPVSVLILFWAVTAGNCVALDDIPRRPPFDRYAGLMSTSPFAIATATINGEKPNSARDLYLANAAKFFDGDMITLQSAVDRNIKEYLTKKGPNEHGYSIIGIDWSKSPAKTRAPSKQ